MAAAHTGGPGGDLDRGRRLGKYEILTRLSMGGMAELFLAFTSGPGGFRKFVAVKQILPDVKKDEKFVKMFLDEARITAAFSHGNIGQVFDLGEEDGELYLAMEFLSGQNLEQISKRAASRQRPLPLGFSCRVVRDVCLGLHYAHAFTDPTGKPAPVIHRDVSPKNVMVTYAGDVKVIDFGIAKAKNRLGRTQVGIVKGTASYMSPEQARNQDLDGRSDLFSIGAMLHELLTGQRLFAGTSDAAMMMAVVEGEIATPRSLNPKVPEALSDLVMRALSRPREGRFANGKEMARAIEQAAGAKLMDEDGLADEMRALFDDRIQATRALLELATRDSGDLAKMADSLQDEASHPESVPAAPPRRPPKESGPAPRGAGTAPPLARETTTPPPSKLRETAAPPRRTGVGGGAKPAAPLAGAQRYSSEVGGKYALYADSDAATEQDQPEPRPSREKARAGPAGERRLPERVAGAGSSVPAQPATVGKRLRWGGWVALAGLACAGYAAATLDATGPVRVEARRWLDAQLHGEPPPPPLPPLSQAPKAPPPPEARRLLEQNKPDQPLTQLPEGYVDIPVPPEPVPEKPKAAAPAKAALARPAAPKTPNADGLAEVVDTRTSRGAAKAGVGWLSLATVPPSAVFDGPTQIGTTPLVKVPFDEGIYRLTVVDPDGQQHFLSAPIKPGEVTTLKIVVSDLPLAN